MEKNETKKSHATVPLTHLDGRGHLLVSGHMPYSVRNCFFFFVDSLCCRTNSFKISYNSLTVPITLYIKLSGCVTEQSGSILMPDHVVGRPRHLPLVPRPATAGGHHRWSGGKLHTFCKLIRSDRYV
jgi:hypothetical protein